MKNLTLLILSFLSLNGFAQKSFAPLGAQWSYEGKSEWNADIQNCVGNHLLYVVEEEPLIDGKDCSLIRAYHSSNLDLNWNYTGDSLIIWEENDQVYFLQDSSQYLLFDFGAELGDTIIRYDPYNLGVFSGTYYADSVTTPNKMEMVVSEISEIQVSGELRKVQTVTHLDPDTALYPFDEILEGIGSVSELFSGLFLFTTANGCDGRLVCYQNDVIDHQTINSFNHPGCIRLPESVEENGKSRISIYPNPLTSELNLLTDLNSYHLKIFDVKGSTLLSRSNQNRLDTDQLSPGMYWLQIFSDRGMQIIKFVKI